MAVAGLLGAVFVPLGVAVGVLGLVAIVLVVTVASASFNAALYWFAVTGESPGGFSAGDLQLLRAKLRGREDPESRAG